MLGNRLSTAVIYTGFDTEDRRIVGFMGCIQQTLATALYVPSTKGGVVEDGSCRTSRVFGLQDNRAHMISVLLILPKLSSSTISSKNNHTSKLCTHKRV